MPNVLWIDVETYSECPIKNGTRRYAVDPSTEITLVAYAFNADPVRVIDLTADYDRNEYQRVFSAIESPDVIKIAHNARFELDLFRFCAKLKTSPEQWRCSMVLCYSMALPGSLEDACEVVNLPSDKRKISDGRRLVQIFCKPRKPTTGRPWARETRETLPDDWARFIVYAAGDVEAMRALWHRVAPIKSMSKQDWQDWHTDQRINDRGLPIDMRFVRACIGIVEAERERLTAFLRARTGVSNPNSKQQMREWFADHGAPLPNLRKLTVADAVEACTDPAIRELLQAYQQLSLTSVDKLYAIERMTVDGRLFGAFQFKGASRTGRYAGRAFQPQNLPRGQDDVAGALHYARELILQGDVETLRLCFGEPISVVSSCLRSCIAAPDGECIRAPDYNAIEARVAAWQCNEHWVLQVFTTHGKIYEATASRMFGYTIEEASANKAIRFKGKVASLALQYQGWAGALEAMGAVRGGIPKEELPDVAAAWRESNQNIVTGWHELENAAKKCVRFGTAQVCLDGRIRFEMQGPFLTVVLPSGRKLWYLRPQVGEKNGRLSLSYEGVHQITKKWSRLDIYGGKWLENIVQAISADILFHGVRQLEAAGYEVIGTVHDEILTCGDPARGSVQEMETLMCELPPWCNGLPMKAKGFQDICYKKD